MQADGSFYQGLARGNTRWSGEDFGASALTTNSLRSACIARSSHVEAPLAFEARCTVEPHDAAVKSSSVTQCTQPHVILVTMQHT